MRGDRNLTRAAQYGLVYRNGRSWSHPLLVVKILPNGLDFSRYGFSISRRLGKAVVRNRVKRVLREIMRKAPLRPGWDIVFIARPPAAGAGYHELDRVIRTLAVRAGALAGEYEKACPGTD